MQLNTEMALVEYPQHY